MKPEDYDLNEKYVCICGHVCTGWQVLDHYKKKHPVLHKEVCERIGLEL